MPITVTRLIAAAAGVLAGTAVARELTKPADQRTWHGEVAGVPYDFRPPTAEKLRRSVWDPDSSQVFVPHAFGVGWSVNFARIAALTEPPQATPAASVAPVPPAKEITDGGTE